MPLFDENDPEAYLMVNRLCRWSLPRGNPDFFLKTRRIMIYYHHKLSTNGDDEDEYTLMRRPREW